MPYVDVKIEDEVSVDIEVFCGQCGRGLCGESEAHRTRQGIVVNPCSDCMANSFEEGRIKGQEDAEEEIARAHEQAIEERYKQEDEEGKNE